MDHKPVSDRLILLLRKAVGLRFVVIPMHEQMAGERP